MENEFLKLIETRRSCRKYLPEQITDEELNAVLRAGTFAPTGMGWQSPFIVAVQQEQMKEKLAAMNAAVRGKAGILITMHQLMYWFSPQLTTRLPFKTELVYSKT